MADSKTPKLLPNRDSGAVRYAELLDNYAAKVRGRILMDTESNASAESEARGALLSWSKEELDHFGKMAAQIQPAPTEHLIRAMASEQASPAPEKCPTCGSRHTWAHDQHRCNDYWHTREV